MSVDPHFGVTQDDQIRESSSLPRDHFVKLATPPTDPAEFDKYVAGAYRLGHKDGASRNDETLRDRFAMAALNQRKMLSTGAWYAADAAREAYEIADAMMKARSL